jgi:hypothetical protein
MEGRPGKRNAEHKRWDDNKQERRTMKSKGAEGLPADPQDSLAANEEEFREVNGDYERLSRRQSGWDPYDVWRTRVKTASRSPEREGEPRH